MGCVGKGLFVMWYGVLGGGGGGGVGGGGVGVGGGRWIPSIQETLASMP